MTYALTPEQVQAAIADHDLTTYKGWTAAARTLLANAPEWTAISDIPCSGYVVKINTNGAEFDCFAVANEGNPNYLYSLDDAFEFDPGTWDNETKAWEGANQSDCIAMLQNPVFASLSHQ